MMHGSFTHDSQTAVLFQRVKVFVRVKQGISGLDAESCNQHVNGFSNRDAA
jgi:hypothetical protein